MLSGSAERDTFVDLAARSDDPDRPLVVVALRDGIVAGFVRDLSLHIISIDLENGRSVAAPLVDIGGVRAFAAHVVGPAGLGYRVLLEGEQITGYLR